jgi:hypothetical protein
MSSAKPLMEVTVEWPEDDTPTRPKRVFQGVAEIGYNQLGHTILIGSLGNQIAHFRLDNGVLSTTQNHITLAQPIALM